MYVSVFICCADLIVRNFDHRPNKSKDDLSPGYGHVGSQIKLVLFVYHHVPIEMAKFVGCCFKVSANPGAF